MLELDDGDLPDGYKVEIDLVANVIRLYNLLNLKIALHPNP